MALVQIDDFEWINTDLIERMEQDENNRQIFHLYLKGGIVKDIEEFWADEITGRSKIVQLIPFQEQTWCLLTQNPYSRLREAEWYKDTVDAIAVCGDGTLRPINYGSYFNGAAYFMDEFGFEILLPDLEEKVDDVDKFREDFYGGANE